MGIGRLAELVCMPGDRLGVYVGYENIYVDKGDSDTTVVIDQIVDRLWRLVQCGRLARTARFEGIGRGCSMGSVSGCGGQQAIAQGKRA